MEEQRGAQPAASPALSEWGASLLRIRIGVFGHPSSGKEHLIHSMSLLRHTDANRKASRGSSDSAQPPAKQKDSPSSSFPSHPTAILPADNLATHDAFLRDAAMCLLERGHFGVGGVEVPFPTRTSLRIVCPPSQAHKKESDDPTLSTAPTDLSQSPASTGEDTAATRLEVELVNCWTVIADDSKATGAASQSGDDRPTDSLAHLDDTSRRSSPVPRRAVLFQDLDLVLCDAFLIVFDVTSTETFAACRSMLHQLAQIFGQSGTPHSSTTHRASGGADQPHERMPVAIAVIASTHKISTPTSSAFPATATTRRVSSDQCRQLATTFHVPVFELSLLPHDVSRQRKALERVLQRVLKLLP